MVQFSCSVMSTLCDPMDCSMLGFPVHHQLPELAQTHVYRVCDAIQPSHPLLPLLLLPSIFPSIRVFSSELALHIREAISVGASTSASVLPVTIQSWFPLRLAGWSCYPRDSKEFSPAPQFESINSSMLSLLYSPALTSIHDYWKNQSCDYTDLCWPSLCFLICCLGLP